MRTYPQFTREEIEKARGELSSVSERIRQGKLSFRAGAWELMQSGMPIGHAVDWIMNTTTAQQRAQVKDPDDYGMSDSEYFLRWHLHQEAQEEGEEASPKQ